MPGLGLAFPFSRSPDAHLDILTWTYKIILRIYLQE